MMRMLDPCVGIRPSLAGFVDDELDGTARLRVARHLERCSDCADRVEELRDLGDLLRAAVPAESHLPELAGLASGVVSRTRAELQESWRGWVLRACDGWHWAIVGAGSVAATFVTTSILSLILAFGPQPAHEDSLSSLMVNLGSPSGDIFVFASPVGGEEFEALLQVDNGRPTASRMSAELASEPSQPAMSVEASLVRALNEVIAPNGHMIAFSAMSAEKRATTEALLNELARVRVEQAGARSRGRFDARGAQNIREIRFVTSVTAKRL